MKPIHPEDSSSKEGVVDKEKEDAGDLNVQKEIDAKVISPSTKDKDPPAHNDEADSASNQAVKFDDSVVDSEEEEVAASEEDTCAEPSETASTTSIDEQDQTTGDEQAKDPKQAKGDDNRVVEELSKGTLEEKERQELDECESDDTGKSPKDEALEPTQKDSTEKQTIESDILLEQTKTHDTDSEPGREIGEDGQDLAANEPNDNATDENRDFLPMNKIAEPKQRDDNEETIAGSEDGHTELAPTTISSTEEDQTNQAPDADIGPRGTIASESGKGLAESDNRIFSNQEDTSLSSTVPPENRNENEDIDQKKIQPETAESLSVTELDPRGNHETMSSSEKAREGHVSFYRWASSEESESSNPSDKATEEFQDPAASARAVDPIHFEKEGNDGIILDLEHDQREQDSSCQDKATIQTSRHLTDLLEAVVAENEVEKTYEGESSESSEITPQNVKHLAVGAFANDGMILVDLEHGQGEQDSGEEESIIQTSLKLAGHEDTPAEENNFDAVAEDGQGAVDPDNETSTEQPCSTTIGPTLLGRANGKLPSLTFLLCPVAVVFMVVFLVLFVLTRNNDNESGDEQWRLSVRTYLSSLGLSLEEDLSTRGTPQFQALEWLETRDTFEFPIATAEAVERGSFDSILVERYVLAVLYYALSGEDWNHQLRFLSPLHSCAWGSPLATATGDLILLGVSACHQEDDGGLTGTVKSLEIRNNNLQGTLPQEIQYLRDLESLSILFEPGLTGTLPTGISNLRNLEVVEFPYSSLSGTIPNEIGDLVGLTSLQLSNTMLTGEVPASFFQLTRLETLALDDNELSAPMDSFGALTNLEVLYLENNQFHGSLSESLLDSWSESLEEMDLSDNKLAAQPLPSNLFGLDKLLAVDLHGNNFLGSIPTVTTPNSTLQFLSLYDNQLNSSIPDSIRGLDNLSHLDLSRNRLTSTIPDGIVALSRLKNLYLGSNEFSASTIPTELFELSNLHELSLKDASLVGTLSTLIGRLTSLRLLDLHSNGLVGSIPYQLANLSDLRFLLLNRNSLFGLVPEAFSVLNDLDVLLLDNNNLIGSLNMVCGENGDADITTTFISSDCVDEISCSCCALCCEHDDWNCNNLDYHVNLDPIWEYDFERVVYHISQNEIDAP